MPHSSGKRKLAALPLHLTLALLPWLASNAALRLSNDGWRRWSPLMSARPDAPKDALAELWQRMLEEPELAKAVESEARSNILEFLQGVLRYQDMPYTRRESPVSCIAHCGSARLLDYGGDPLGGPLLLIPSLINRYYILDLNDRLSLARYLAGRGYRVFMVDWGVPGTMEQTFNCADYITRHLSVMAEAVVQVCGVPFTAVGYCMGGLLALGLAAAFPAHIKAIACLATPWDFSVPEFPRNPLLSADPASLLPLLSGKGEVSEEAIHTLFHLAHPFAFQKKLRDFSAMKEGSQEMQDFLALEHWVQDGVPLVRGVAEDCLIHWSQRNVTARLEWTVGGEVVNPAKLTIPAFIAAPRDDSIVPSSSALPLARLCRNSTLIEPTSGHVGMVVGKRRKTALWDPLCRWLDQQVS